MSIVVPFFLVAPVLLVPLGLRLFVLLPIAAHLVIARLPESTMRVPLVTTAQAHILAEGIVEPLPPSPTRRLTIWRRGRRSRMRLSELGCALFLARHMTRLLEVRNAALKAAAERSER